ncbi:acyl-CoA thioesterase [Prosthecomicrobium hirschii]|uniref:Acyl-CoA thioesterase 2 n=1 Tax=Prosthecodimorpha hirschii TaxID=665126 RepID=A0A0P6W6W9_9HYPH|nr:acyl-CoA thioesterase II [Prosthecomicrobium hirschii]KPL53088.1 acyl-CoA thioesterase [Prosthecomicrobium hirschii]
MKSAVEQLLESLDLEPLEVNLFRGRSLQVGWQRIFGGQVIGQAVAAAARTVADRAIHSLHAYFLRPGDPSYPIVYEVDRIRDGGSFTTRRVLAIQKGEPIFSMAASYHKAETGLTHQIAMPDVPGPDDLPSEAELRERYLAEAPENVRRYWMRPRPIELRPVDFRHYVSREPLEPTQFVWLRATGPLPDDPSVHAAVLAYASDTTLLDTSLFAHGRSVFDHDLRLASLDHAMWFHAPFRVDDWLLYAQDSPATGAGRGFNRGTLFDRTGRLVASAVQEGVIRQVRQS